MKKKILLVDDEIDNIKTLEFTLRTSSPDYIVIKALNGSTAIDLVKEEDPDTVLLDLNMPGMDGYEVCRRIRALKIDKYLPIVFLTGHYLTTEDRIRGYDAGCDDYIFKPIEKNELLARLRSVFRIKELNDHIRNERDSLGEKVNTQAQELVKSQYSIHERERQLAAIVKISLFGIFNSDSSGKYLYVNKRWSIISGLSPEEAKGNNWTKNIHMEDKQRIIDIWNSVVKKREQLNIEYRFVHNDGSVVWVHSHAIPDQTGEHKDVIYIGIITDITEHRLAEEELQKTQRLESLGILAGGIAHDFNNLLGGLFGYIEIAKQLSNKKSDSFKYLKKSLKAFQRAKDLTQQLLTFSKGGIPLKKVTSINEILQESCEFSLSGSNIKYTVNINAALYFVEVDEGQMAQVFNNIIINARQAMPEGGNLKIEAYNMFLQENEMPHLVPGNYIKIKIKDNGEGIKDSVLSKIFDPFFSTKQKGSGLGLSTCYSIVNNHNGWIMVDSELNNGTTFSIFLPASKKNIVNKIGKEDSVSEYINGQGKILLMDDEEIILEMAGDMLSTMGYEVDFAENGEKALEIYKREFNNGKGFDLIILDLTVINGMGGKKAVKNLLKLNPDIKVIVSSGYSEDPVIAEFKKWGFKASILKPYRMNELSSIVHEIISND